MKYRHYWFSGDRIDLPVGKVVCVGRNYAAHIAELSNPIPETPMLFIKPDTALTPLSSSLLLPKGRGEVHFETEIALLIKEPLTNAGEQDAMNAVLALGLGLDLTLRDLQNRQKNQGLPWEIAKAFDRSCPVSGFVAKEHVGSFDDINFNLSVNNELRQQGNSSQMLTSIPKLLSYMSRHFTLQPGDIIMTGTPAGVGALNSGDKLTLSLNELFTIHTRCR